MSVPDLVLEGHSDIAEFAVGVSSKQPLVASGGRDTNVRISARSGVPLRRALRHIVPVI